MVFHDLSIQGSFNKQECFSWTKSIAVSILQEWLLGNLVFLGFLTGSFCKFKALARFHYFYYPFLIMHNFYFHNKLKKLCKESKVNMHFNEHSYISMHNLKSESNEKKCQFNITTESLNKNCKDAWLRLTFSNMWIIWSIWCLSHCYSDKNVSPNLWIQQEINQLNNRTRAWIFLVWN